jgi:hypothetical protein
MIPNARLWSPAPFAGGNMSNSVAPKLAGLLIIAFALTAPQTCLGQDPEIKRLKEMLPQLEQMLQEKLPVLREKLPMLKQMMEQKLQSLEPKLDRLEQRLQSLEEKIYRLEQKDTFR